MQPKRRPFKLHQVQTGPSEIYQDLGLKLIQKLHFFECRIVDVAFSYVVKDRKPKEVAPVLDITNHKHAHDLSTSTDRIERPLPCHQGSFFALVSVLPFPLLDDELLALPLYDVRSLVSGEPRLGLRRRLGLNRDLHW